MPFYYGSRARSVPEYLKLRLDEKTRGSEYVSLRRADSEASVTRAMSRESRVLASSEFGICSPLSWRAHVDKREVAMGDLDSTAHKAKAKAKAAEGDQIAAERAAAAAEERALRARLALKKAKKASKKATKSARKARKAAEAAQKAFAKAAARVARAEADVAKAQRVQKKRVTEQGATVKGAAAKVVHKKTAGNGAAPRKAAAQKRVHRATVSRPARRPRRAFRVQVPAPATVPAISALEPSDGSETFLLGQSDLT